MEGFSLLKFWRVSAGGDNNVTTIPSETTTNGGRGRSLETGVETDDEEFFDLEFDVSSSSDGDTRSNFVESPNDFCLRRSVTSPLKLKSNSKPESRISFLRSPPRFRVFTLMLFKKPKSEKIETAGFSPPAPKHQVPDKRFTDKCKVEEVPILPFLTKVNSSRDKSKRQTSEDASSKRVAKDVVHKYLNLIKPLYVRVSKSHGENPKFSDRFSPASPASSPAMAPVSSRSRQADEVLSSRVASPRFVCKHLGKSRSASSAAGIAPLPGSKRDDSLLLQHDGIQSAILHCKSSYKSSRDLAVLSRFATESSQISAILRNSTEEEKNRSSI